MPYTPPAARSPSASRPTTPKFESFPKQSHEQSHASKPELPHSTSSKAYLTKHRRSPSISDPNSGAPIRSFAADATAVEPKSSDSKDEQSNTSTGRRPRGGVAESSTAPTISPNLSPTQSSSDEEPSKRRGRVRDAANFAELQAAIRIIEQHRSGSPEFHADEPSDKEHSSIGLSRPRIDIPQFNYPYSDMDDRRPLSDSARKISHSRSSTDASAFLDFPRNKLDSPALSLSVSDAEDDEEDADAQAKPSLIRKKSGELVRPALRASSMRRRPSSMPGTPTYAKAVHFQDSSLEHIRHFLKVDRPIAVSAGTSPVESNYEEDGEFPFNLAFDWEIRLTNFPHNPFGRLPTPVKLEKVYLSTDTKTLMGAVAVQNLAFHKLVVARFTLDDWKTTSEVVAEYNADVRKKVTYNGFDRFTFSIRLEDQANLENKTMLICIRYNVNGQDYWDNNNNLNYQIDFSKKFNQASQPKDARSLNALPRSKPHRAPDTTPRTRPWTMQGLDDFPVNNMAPYDFPASPRPSAIIGDSPLLHRNKTLAEDILGNGPGQATPSSYQQAFGNRYDFGASLSAVMSPKSGVAKDKTAPPPRTPNAPRPKFQTSPVSALNVNSGELSPSSLAAGPKPAALTAEKPSMQSPTYEQLLANYCFYGSAPKASSIQLNFKYTSNASQVGLWEDTPKPKPKAPKIPLGRIEASIEPVEHTKLLTAPTPHPTNTTPIEERRSTSKITSPRASRSASPATAMGSRARSPNAFGYPYHKRIQNGFFDLTPTAIHG